MEQSSLKVEVVVYHGGLVAACVARGVFFLDWNWNFATSRALLLRLGLCLAINRFALNLNISLLLVMVSVFFVLVFFLNHHQRTALAVTSLQLLPSYAIPQLPKLGKSIAMLTNFIARKNSL